MNHGPVAYWPSCPVCGSAPYARDVVVHCVNSLRECSWRVCKKCSVVWDTKRAAGVAIPGPRYFIDAKDDAKTDGSAKGERGGATG